MNKNLSICIPTYNRAKFLDENLEKLIPLCKKYSISINISDNNSPDNTLDVVNKHKKKYKFLFYKKLEKNLGIDLNMDSVIEISDSKFSWLFSDDDIIDDDSIEIILDIINIDNPDFILLNHREKDLETRELITERYLNTDNNNQIINHVTLLEKYAHQMTLLSACVVKTKDWKKISFSSYKAKFYFHIHNIFYNLNSNSTIVFVGRPLFTKFNGNYWQFEKKELDAVLHFHYPTTINDLSDNFRIQSKLIAIKPKVNKISIGTFIKLRGGDYISIFYLPKVFFYLLGYRFFVSIIFLFLPSSLSNFIYKSYNRFLR